MQYRASFAMLTLGQFAITGIDFLGIWAMFTRFGSLRGWLLAEVALFYGTVQVAFALGEAFGRGFDTFSNLVKSGDFDRLLLRPRGTAFQVAAAELQVMRVGRLIQGLVVLLCSASALGIQWTVDRAALLVFMIFGGACLFYALFVLQATISFWTIESLEVLNTVTYGGTETGQYPLTIYRPWFRRFFTVVVPLVCMNYIPASAILNRETGISPALAYLSPLAGILFLAIMLQIWEFGVRHYRSTGS